MMEILITRAFKSGNTENPQVQRIMMCRKMYDLTLQGLTNIAPVRAFRLCYCAMSSIVPFGSFLLHTIFQESIICQTLSNQLLRTIFHPKFQCSIVVALGLLGYPQFGDFLLRTLTVSEVGTFSMAPQSSRPCSPDELISNSSGLR